MSTALGCLFMLGESVSHSTLNYLFCSFYVDGLELGKVNVQATSNVVAVGNTPAGNEPWGAMNSFLLHRMALSAKDVLEFGRSYFNEGSGLRFSQLSYGVINDVARTYSNVEELSVLFWARSLSSNFSERQGLLSGIDWKAARQTSLPTARSGFVFWINPCGQPEFWVRSQRKLNQLNGACVFGTLAAMQLGPYLSSNCSLLAACATDGEISVGIANSVWSVLTDRGFGWNQTNNGWFHMVGSYSQGSLSLFRNGALVDSQSATLVAPRLTDNVNLVLGRQQHWDIATDVAAFDGTLDEISNYSNYDHMS